MSDIAEQPNNFIFDREYRIVYFEGEKRMEITAELVGTSQPAMFSPVWFDFVDVDEPGELFSIKVSDIIKMSRKACIKFRHKAKKWKEWFESVDEIESFENTLYEYKIDELGILILKDKKIQNQIIEDFKRSKSEIEKVKKENKNGRNKETN